jgi:hypothetical protein
MKKRGQGVQFNWIFVVIAGIFVLLFVLGFLVKYIDLQDSKQNAQTAWDFKNHILGIKSTEQYSNFSIPRSKIDYDCENIVINDDISFEMPYTVFTEGFDSGNILFWVEDYYQGFLVDRVVFISDARKKYYFDESYRANIPPNIKLVSNHIDADIIVSSNPSFVSNHPDKKEIFVDNVNGIIKFINDNIYFPYEDDFFIYAAAFSNSTTFKCGKDSLDERSNLISDLYISKISYLSVYQGAGCNPLYNQLRNTLISGNSIEIKEANNNLVNYNCEVVF